MISPVAEFRQEFKTHEIARKSMEKIVQPFVDQSTRRQRQCQSERLCDRLYDLGNELETVNLEVEMLREQCIYLMDSEFNTVAARTDARLSILTILAYVITPAGFVVTLFSVITAGTTQLIVSTILVGSFSIVIYIVVDGLYRSAERRRLPNDLAVPARSHVGG
jgi:Mg2+ and Co2+ transporter CorA